MHAVNVFTTVALCFSMYVGVKTSANVVTTLHWHVELKTSVDVSTVCFSIQCNCSDHAHTLRP